MAIFIGYVALGTGLGPGYSFAELSGGSYARQALSLSGSILAGASQTLSAFGAAALPSTGNIRNGAIFDALTGGNLLAYWDWVPAQTATTTAFPSTVLNIALNNAISTTSGFSIAPFLAGDQIGTANLQPLIAGSILVQRGGSFIASVSETVVPPANANYVVRNLTATNLILESAIDTISAAGTTQATATQIVAQTSRITTAAAPSGGIAPGVMLPPSIPGLELIVINHGANAMQVYGTGADTIDDVAATTGVQQMASSMCIYTCATAGNWYSNGIGTGYAGQFPIVSYTNGVTAFAGGGQAGPTAANGALIGTAIFRVTTVGTAADSVRLPIAAAGMQINVSNAAASNSMNVFPGTGDAINALAANAAFAIAAGKTAQFSSAVPGFWHSVLSA